MQLERSWTASASIQNNRSLVTPHAYAAFLLTWVSANAVRQRDWRVFFYLVWQAFRHGRPKAIDLLLHFSIWFVPLGLRQQINLHFGRRPGIQP
jgi:hypothetical protein